MQTHHAGFLLYVCVMLIFTDIRLLSVPHAGPLTRTHNTDFRFVTHNAQSNACGFCDSPSINPCAFNSPHPSRVSSFRLSPVPHLLTAFAAPFIRSSIFQAWYQQIRLHRYLEFRPLCNVVHNVSTVPCDDRNVSVELCNRLRISRAAARRMVYSGAQRC